MYKETNQRRACSVVYMYSYDYQTKNLCYVNIELRNYEFLDKFGLINKDKEKKKRLHYAFRSQTSLYDLSQGHNNVFLFTFYLQHKHKKSH